MSIAKRLLLFVSLVVAVAASWKGVELLTRPPAGAAPFVAAGPAGKVGKAARPAAAPAHAAALPPAEEHVEDMVRAAAGDPEKSFIAFQKIEECLTLERDKEIVDDIDVKMGKQESGFELQILEHKADELTLQRLRRTCAGLTGRTRLDRFQLLRYAVDRNVSGALTVYIFAGPHGERSALKERPLDPVVVEWRNDALRRLDEHIAQGYPDALLIGATAYNQLGRVPTTADLYMIYTAANKVLGALNANEGVYPKSLLDAWAKDLTEQQRNDADAQAYRIFLAWQLRQAARPAQVASTRQPSIAGQ